MPTPKDTEACKWHEYAPAQFVGINIDQRLYVVECGGGYSCLGFDYARQKTQGVLEWLGKPYKAESSLVAEYAAYKRAMADGARHAKETNTRCNIELTPALIGLEGKRVEVTGPDGYKERFWVGKSTGWMPCHLKIKTSRSHGGCAVYIPNGGNVRVVG